METDPKKTCVNIVISHGLVFVIANALIYYINNRFWANCAGIDIDLPFYGQIWNLLYVFMRKFWYIYILISAGVLYGDYRILCILASKEGKHLSYWSLFIRITIVVSVAVCYFSYWYVLSLIQMGV